MATPTGAKPIGTLTVGEQVLAYDGATGKVKAEPVQHVFVHHDTNLLDVTLSTPTTATTKASQPGQDHSSSKQQAAEVAAHGSQAPPATETLHTTTEHPFLTTDRGFVPALLLRLGEMV